MNPTQRTLRYKNQLISLSPNPGEPQKTVHAELIMDAFIGLTHHIHHRSFKERLRLAPERFASGARLEGASFLQIAAALSDALLSLTKATNKLRKPEAWHDPYVNVLHKQTHHSWIHHLKNSPTVAPVERTYWSVVHAITTQINFDAWSFHDQTGRPLDESKADRVRASFLGALRSLDSRVRRVDDAFDQLVKSQTDLNFSPNASTPKLGSLVAVLLSIPSDYEGYSNTQAKLVEFQAKQEYVRAHLEAQNIHNYLDSHRAPSKDLEHVAATRAPRL